MVEEEIKEIEETKETGLDGSTDALSDGSAPGQGTGSSSAPHSPFDDFMMVGLSIPGLMAGKSKTEDHIAMIFRRLQKDHITSIGKLKNHFYRYLKKQKAFKMDGKYFIPLDKEKAVDEKYREVYYDFQGEKQKIADDLIQNFDKYVDEVYQTYPDFIVDREKVMELKPMAADFMGMDYTKKSLSSYISEHAGFSDVITNAMDLNPDQQQKFENQKTLVEAKIRNEFRHKIEDLEEKNEKLRGMVKKTGKRYEKMAMEFENETENLIKIGELLGEKETAQMKVEALMESLANKINGGKN